MNNSVPLVHAEWTTEEVKAWVMAGLVPVYLLDPTKSLELVEYLQKNKEILSNYNKETSTSYLIDNLRKSKLTLSLPPLSTLPATQELQMKDPKTKVITSTMNLLHKLELYDGIFFSVNEQELESWNKATTNIQELTREQGKDFKETILKVSSRGAISREEIVTVLEEVRKKRKTAKVRRSGHYIDVKLTKDKAISHEIHSLIATTVKTPGIKLTPAEDKLVGAFYNLLYKTSETKDSKSKSFYMGNGVAALVTGHGSMSARFICKPADLYKEYLGTDSYSGKDIQNIKNILHGLVNKKHLMQYNRQRQVVKDGKTETVTDRINVEESLVIIMSYYDGMTDREVKNLDAGDQIIRDQKEELIIALNPILTDQISSKYVEYPMDISPRTNDASGGAKRVSESIIALRDYMLREISSKHYTCPMNEETLISQLGLDKAARSGKKKIVTTRIEDAIKASKNLGIILDVKLEIGAQGQTKYIFTLNPEFE